MRGTNRIAKLEMGVRGQVMSLRRAGRSCLEICERLGLDKASERNAVSAICAEPELRKYSKGFEVGGPVKAGRNPAAVIRP
jgi:hypothetical protein